MIRGILHGKFTPNEDQLTSTVFGLLELMTPSVLLGWLCRARPSDNMGPDGLHFTEPAQTRLIYWPRTERHGEPDLLLLVDDRTTKHAIIIEAKQGAGKSQWDAVLAEDSEADRATYDQLVRYWIALRTSDFRAVSPEELAGRLLTVVYLTPHLAPPRAELEESMAREPAMRLAWLSWRELHTALAATAHEDENATQARVRVELTALLRYLGLTSFASFDHAGLQPVRAGLSWRFDPADFAGTAAWTCDPMLTWKP